MTQPYDLFQRFLPALRSSADDKTFLLETDSGYSVYYVPFEYVNTQARLVVVGITPGPEQMKCAYATARKLIASSASIADCLREIKRSCAFLGMRDKINEMLDHFKIPHCIGARDAASLWGSNYGLFHTTSVVPNAAFRNGAYFNGPFSAVLDIPLLRKQFENTFIPSVERIGKDAFYVGMGPVVDEALAWCTARGVLAPRQILGYFPHASGASGSQFAYFMRKKQLAELKPKDPVRHRVRDLDAAYQRIAANVQSVFSTRRAAG